MTNYGADQKNLPVMIQYLLSALIILSWIEVNGQSQRQRIDSLLSALYPVYQPGAAVALVTEGKVIFSKGYGLADMGTKRAVTLSTSFNIGSLTKQFTAICILKLAEGKKLSLDDPLGKYFPEFQSDIAARITIRQMLTHSSGIMDHYGYVDKTKYHDFWDKDVLEAVKTLDSLYFQSGTAYHYSNTAYCLLSLIIEKVTGTSYPDYLRKTFFEPLGMKNSQVIHPGWSNPERALGYEDQRGIFTLSDAEQSLFFTTMGDGGVYSSVNDIMKWIRLIWNRKGPYRNLFSDAMTPRFTIDKTRNLSYGYGWFISGSGKNRVIFHTGSNGGFRAILIMIPDIRYSVVILSNRTGIDLEDLVHRINRIMEVRDSSFVKLESLID
jgi:CubicO group peptidase (beta-lactamase class C family)